MRGPDKNLVSVAHILPAFLSDFTPAGVNLLAASGGCERYVIELARATSLISKTTLIVFGSKNAIFDDKALKVRVLKSRPFLPRINGFADFFSLKLLLLINKYDAVHAHQYYSDSTMISAFGSLIWRKDFYVTDHGYRGLNLARYFPSKFIARKLLGQTAYEAKRFKIKNDKFKLIYGGINIEKYDFETNKQPIVIFLGRILPHKGVNYLIEAIDNGVQCIIAGHANNQQYMSDLKKMAVGKNVEFLLSANDEKIRNLLKKASVLVLPSVDEDMYGARHNHPELFGLVIAEAFASGTPAIVSNSSALPYVVDDNVTGYVVSQNSASEIKEKIAHLLKNPRVLLRMSEAARNIATTEYNWAVVGAKCVDTYMKRD